MASNIWKNSQSPIVHERKAFTPRCARMSVKAAFGLVAALGLISACGTDRNKFRSVDDAGGAQPIVAADAAPRYVKTFQAGQLETIQATIESGFALIRQNFSLVQAPKTVELSQQLERAKFEDTFQQGHGGFPKTETFSIAEAGIFDLLIVIDDSSSMGPYQSRLSKTLPSILRYISATNWRIAVVTSSSSCLRETGDGRRFITRAEYDADPAKASKDFKKLILVGDGGDPIERGIKMLTDAMLGAGCVGDNSPWLRADSQRSILLATDENNCGSGPNEGCAGSPWEKADYFFDRVGYNVPVNALLLLQEPPSANPWDPADPNHDCENSGGYGEPPNPSEYLRLIQKTGGIYSDVCRSNYNAVLEQISLNVRKKTNIQFELAYPAVPTSLELAIDGRSIKNYTITDKTLTILEPVDENAQSLTVGYRHSPVNLVKSFKPSHLADATSFEVLINGEMLPKYGYEFHPESGELVLNNFPPEFAQIKLRYRDNQQLRKEFSYRKNIVPINLEVWVDDKQTSEFIHDPLQKRITFTKAPADGQMIAIQYELPGDRTLKYAIYGADASSVERLKVVDRDTGVELKASISNGQIELENSEIAQGRKVQAVYNMAYAFKDKVFSLAIAAQPFPGSLKIVAEGDRNVCTDNVKVFENQLQFRCKDEDFERIGIEYQVAADYTNSFDVSVDYSGPRSYEVQVNGQKIDAYHIIENRLIILKKDLPPGAEVKVLIQPT